MDAHVARSHCCLGTIFPSRRGDRVWAEPAMFDLPLTLMGALVSRDPHAAKSLDGERERARTISEGEHWTLSPPVISSLFRHDRGGVA